MSQQEHEQALTANDVQCLTIEDQNYPPLLRATADPPAFLYTRGDLSLLQKSCIALVGTRRMSTYGKRVTGAFVPLLVRAGCITVSGLAFGIDAEVARETLRCGGRTVAVLGHGLLRPVYPRTHTKLAEEIVQAGGLLLSEYTLDVPPAPHTFPARNRIIAGLCRGTLVLEAPEKSGALITASFALEEGREVFAIPGVIFDPNFAGCHRLIGRGEAKLVVSPREVLEELGIPVPEEGETAGFVPATPEEEKVFSTLTTMPQSVDGVFEQTGIPAASVNAVLTRLELEGAARNLGGGQWVRG